MVGYLLYHSAKPPAIELFEYDCSALFIRFRPRISSPAALPCSPCPDSFPDRVVPGVVIVCPLALTHTHTHTDSDTAADTIHTGQWLVFSDELPHHPTYNMEKAFFPLSLRNLFPSAVTDSQCCCNTQFLQALQLFLIAALLLNTVMVYCLLAKIDRAASG